ncbi:MAG: LD-carboxypeptidase, partial [Turicibacter sp.]|nr:LD-carboxypeptidase [Turicibacter sp.]
MRYPVLKRNSIIGMTAPSSGVPEVLHGLVRECCKRMEQRGYKVIVGETTWTQYKAKSADASERAIEFQCMMQDEGIDLVVPPWGGELVLEILDKIDFSKIPEKWVLGYSDISTLLLAITFQTGIATAHGTNIIDLRGEFSDETTAMWETVLSTHKKEEVVQYSSLKYQKEWQHEKPSACIFHLTEQTKWKTISDDGVIIQGRLLGGCIDSIRHLIGTPYGNVAEFREKHTDGEPVVWYLE